MIIARKFGVDRRFSKQKSFKLAKLDTNSVASESGSDEKIAKVERCDTDRQP